MCKRKSYRIESPAMAVQGAYEGKTTRLAYAEAALPERSMLEERRNGRHGHFPWWSLWLIWPLIGLLKWMVPIYIGALAALRDTFSTQAQPVAMIIAVLLIVAGLALIRRG
jgi:hypothetical protein